MTSIHDKVIMVFKTNVLKYRDAKKLLSYLLEQFPTHRVNFDLEDCDKILRIEGTQISCETIIYILNKNNYQCLVLE